MTQPHTHMPTVYTEEDLSKDLRTRITNRCIEVGLSVSETATYVLALEEHGILEPCRPDWIKRSLRFQLLCGLRPNLTRLKEIHQLILTAMREHTDAAFRD